MFKICLSSLLTLNLLSSCGSVKNSSNTKDIVTLDNQGQVVLFFKQGEFVVKKNCADYTFIEDRANCTGKSQKLSVKTFKNMILNVLTEQRFDYLNQELKRSLHEYQTLMNSGHLSLIEIENIKKNIEKLRLESLAIEVDIKKIEDFIEVFGVESADLQKLAALRMQLKKQIDSISIENSNLENIEINYNAMISSKEKIDRLIDNLIENLLSSNKIHFVRNSGNDIEKMYFNLLNFEIKSNRKILSVHAGGLNTCALVSEYDVNSLRCWGSENLVKITEMKSFETANLVSLSTFAPFVCSSGKDRSECLGIQYQQNLSPNLKQIQAGDAHFCSLNDSKVECFGDNSVRQSNVPSLKNPSAISVGGSTSCAIDDLGLKCWGANPINLTTKPLIYKTTDLFSCMVNDNSKVSCSGNQEFMKRKSLNQIPAHQTASELSLGYQHACLLEKNQVKCWGDSNSFQKMLPENLSNPRSLTSGNFHNCLVDDHGIKCFGSNKYGQLNIPQDLIDLN